MRTRPFRHVLPVGVLAVLTLSATAASSVAGASTVPPDDSTPDVGEIVIVDEGKGDERFDLTPTWVVGMRAHSAESSTTAGMIEVTDQSTTTVEFEVVTEVNQVAEVTAVAADGGYTTVRTVESYDAFATSGPASLVDSFRADEELSVLVGIPLEQHYDAAGRLLSVEPMSTTPLSPEQSEAIAELIEDGDRDRPMPDVEVGVGAIWTAELNEGQDAAGASARYSLVSIEDRVATLEVTMESDSDDLQGLLSPGFDTITGTMAGTGTATVDLDNQLATTFVTTLDIDVTLTGPNGTMSMDVTMHNEQVTTPG